MGKKMKIGVIGCGVRAPKYFEALDLKRPGEYELAAVADPNETNAAELKSRHGHEGTRVFRSHDEMLEGAELDGVLVTSPNSQHLKPALELYDRGIPFVLEKPVVTTLEDCRALKEKSRESATPAMVGFCLRYTPFYRKVKELVDSGIVGQVLAINATEPISNNLTIVFNRSWRREVGIAGPFILEKCCHDMDIIRMVAGGEAEEVVSFGRRSHFNRQNQPASYCGACPVKDECVYSSEYNTTRVCSGGVDPHNDDYEGMLDRIGSIEGEREVCVYNDFDHPDHQTVSIAFDNGVLANFTYAWGQSKRGGGRTIHIHGSKGQLFGNIGGDQSISVSCWDGTESKSETFGIETDGSSHGGGDGLLASTFMDIMRGEPCDIKAGMEDGIEAARLALAADLSHRRGEKVRMRDL